MRLFHWIIFDRRSLYFLRFAKGWPRVAKTPPFPQSPSLKPAHRCEAAERLHAARSLRQDWSYCYERVTHAIASRWLPRRTRRPEVEHRAVVVHSRRTRERRFELTAWPDSAFNARHGWNCFLRFIRSVPTPQALRDRRRPRHARRQGRAGNRELRRRQRIDGGRGGSRCAESPAAWRRAGAHLRNHDAALRGKTQRRGDRRSRDAAGGNSRIGYDRLGPRRIVCPAA